MPVPPHPTSYYATASSHQLLCYCHIPPVVMLLPHPTSCYATATSHQLLCYCLIPPVVMLLPHPTSCYATASSHQLLCYCLIPPIAMLHLVQPVVIGAIIISTHTLENGMKYKCSVLCWPFPLLRNIEENCLLECNYQLLLIHGVLGMDVL